MMADVVDMIKARAAKQDASRDQIRADFPLCTQAVEQFRAAFGAGVKPLYFSEGGKTMGKQQPFEGTDVDKIIRMADMDASRGARTR